VLASLRSDPTPTSLAHRFLVGNPNALHASLPAAGWTPLRFAKHFVRFERVRPVAGPPHEQRRVTPRPSALCPLDARRTQASHSRSSMFEMFRPSFQKFDALGLH
jgi:hypothetical protein